jgi:hypothetical protein
MSRTPESFGRKMLGIALLIFLLPIILPIAIVVLVLYHLNKAAVYLLVWALWLPQGKDVLYMSSNSPVWKEYMDTEILPLITKRAVILDWSARSKWPKLSFSVHVFRAFGGRREFNPMIVLFRPFRAAQIFRFFRAFKDRKHGDSSSLDQIRRDFNQSLHHR